MGEILKPEFLAKGTSRFIANDDQNAELNFIWVFPKYRIKYDYKFLYKYNKIIF